MSHIPTKYSCIYSLACIQVRCTERRGEWLAALLRFQEVLGSIFGAKTDYPDWGVSLTSVAISSVIHVTGHNTINSCWLLKSQPKKLKQKKSTEILAAVQCTQIWAAILWDRILLETLLKNIKKQRTFCFIFTNEAVFSPTHSLLILFRDAGEVNVYVFEQTPQLCHPEEGDILIRNIYAENFLTIFCRILFRDFISGPAVSIERVLKEQWTNRWNVK